MLFLFMLLVSVVGCFVEWVEELCVTYTKMIPNWSNKLSTWCLEGVSERSWELLGHPWRLKVGPRVDFYRISDKNIYVLSKRCVGIIFYGFDDFLMNTGVCNEKVDFMKHLVSLK